MGRTSTTEHKRWRTKVINAAKANGQSTCPLCHVWLDWERAGHPNSVEADHIVPAALGGTNTLDNGRAICRTCNRKLGGHVGARSVARARSSRRSPDLGRRIALETSRRW